MITIKVQKIMGEIIDILLNGDSYNSCNTTRIFNRSLPFSPMTTIRLPTQ